MHPVPLNEMHPMVLPFVSVVLLGLAACGGGVLATLRLKKIRIPTAIPVAHGIVAFVGVFALYMGIFDGWINGLGAVAMAGFLFAALTGSYLFGLQLQGRAIPLKFMFFHATVALASYATLLYAIFGPGGGPTRVVS